VTLLEQLTPDLFLSYQQQELPFRLTRQGRPITITTQLGDLCALRQWGRYLVDQDFLVSNPARRMKFPRAPNSLPRVIPDVKEATRLMGGGPSGHAVFVGRDDVCGRGLSIAQGHEAERS
jgi:site-specific recombinase XerC